MSTNKVKHKPAPLPTLTEARELGHNAAVAGFGLDCNPWLKGHGTGQHKDAWNNGFDDFRDKSHPQQELSFDTKRQTI